MFFHLRLWSCARDLQLWQPIRILCDCNEGMFLISYTAVGVAGEVVVVLILRAATLAFLMLVVIKERMRNVCDITLITW